MIKRKKRHGPRALHASSAIFLHIVISFRTAPVLSCPCLPTPCHQIFTKVRSKNKTSRPKDKTNEYNFPRFRVTLRRFSPLIFSFFSCSLSPSPSPYAQPLTVRAREQLLADIRPFLRDTPSASSSSSRIVVPAARSALHEP